MATSQSVISGMPFSTDNLRISLAVRRFVVVFVSHQNVDDEIEAVGLQEGEDVGRTAICNFMNFDAFDAVCGKKIMGTWCGINIDFKF